MRMKVFVQVGGDGWVEGLEGTEDLGAEGDKQAGEGFTKLWS